MINKSMKLHELIENRKPCIRSIAMSIVERHNNGKPTALHRIWISELSINDVFMRELRNEAARYNCIDSSLIDDDVILDTSYMFAQARNILERYRTDMELTQVRSKWSAKQW